MADDQDGVAQPELANAEARVEELTARLHAALEGPDRGRALYVVVSALFGDQLDREVAVANPDTGRVFGHLLPPGDRHCWYAAARPPGHDVLADPPMTLDDIRGRFSRCMDPVPTTVAE
jgi:hypothetical protein